MTYDELKTFLLEFPASTLSFPFDETTAVFKVGEKMFALVSPESDPLRVNLKCDPQDAQALRFQFPAIQPGYHMNKEHWNSVYLDGSLEPSLVKDMIADSYRLVLSSLSKKKQRAIRT
ncbi:MAG: MmcQ/YjbR family DNA-binding protein [Candidatus Marinimicrobia bacterium]|nr:MmcQ/YjbR family DNA-binding protein [Candidatus Neomarinimicrobiota bacterium]MCF7903765.1 MmcQ/YjbR family DNA-binding protein [Candidatus Neomarinimicrobiota bacterium]